MQQHIIENKLSQKPTTSLVCQMTAKDHFVTTPLLKYYLSLGIRVDAVHTFFEYIETTETGNFSDLVIENRKLGDRDPTQKCLGDSWKLAGNSSYGRRYDCGCCHPGVSSVSSFL